MAATSSSSVSKKVAPSKAKKVKEVTKSDTENAPAETPGQNEAVASEVVPAAAVVAVLAVTAPTIATLIDDINNHFQTAEKELRNGKQLLKRLHQLHNKEIKQAALMSKSGRRKRERDPNAPKRQPSGIAKPSRISPELASFLKVDPEAELARTDVIRQIAGYIKSNNLENPTNRREIIPDKDLSKLLGLQKGHEDKITYFNLQRWMKPHFPKAVVAA